MAYGFATHLWILGAPKPEQLKAWLIAASPDVHEGDVEVFQLGDRVLVAAINVSEREPRYRSIGIVTALSAFVKDHAWVSIDLQPDQSSWRIEQSQAEALAFDSDNPEPALLEQAKRAVHSLVPLALDELHHYVDWAHELEDTQEGQLAPELQVPVQRIKLGLPVLAQPSAVAVVARAVPSPLVTFWLEVACLVATAFTVSMSQPPGPAAFTPRLTHFVVQASALWLLIIVLLGVTSSSWPPFKRWLGAVGAFVLCGALWAALPF